tara:strand:+ start:465 stop:767 length:303 start_codon:yes stop_codon:yes gene_type:complete
MATTCLTWGDSDFVWSTNSYTWGDVCLVEKASDGGKSSNYKKRLSADEQKKFIKLVCKVKGIETYSGQKTIEEITVTADDIKLVVKEVLGVDLMVENINV